MSERAAHRFMPWILLLVAGVPWGATFVLTILAVERGDHPVGITFWQTAIGAVALFVFNAARGKPWIPLSAAHVRFYAVCGVLGTALPTISFFYAAEYVQAGVLSLSTATVPMTTFALAFVLRMERYETLRMLGLMLGCAAIAMITVPETSLPDPEAWFWVLVTVVGATCYSLENVFIGRSYPGDDDPFVILAGMLIAALLLLTPVVIVSDGFMVPAWPLETVEWSIIGMGIINVMAYGLFIHIINVSGPVFASQMGYVVTLAGVAWGMIVFGEQHSLWFWGALVAMMAGLTLVRPRESDGAPIAVAHPGDHLADQVPLIGDEPDEPKT
ncbi:MAG: DMT family transporter [Rhodospirillales bacterium]